MYERIYGNKVDLKLTDEAGEETGYSYIPNEGNTRYAISGLAEGVYKFQASTVIADETVVVRGEFLVKEVQLEKLQLTADFNLLRTLSTESGGSFYQTNELGLLNDRLSKENGQAVIHTNEEYLPFINMQWLFFVLLLLVSAEWFIRKFSGSY